jgi:hypothetical protein
MTDRKPFAERRRLSLADFREQALEAQGQMASITLEGKDGETFEIPHPMLVPDEAQKRLEIVQAYEDLDKDKDGRFVEPPTINKKRAEPFTIRLAKALLGEDEHKRFVAAGGNSNDVSLAWTFLSQEHKERAEADPK